jgi:hypothetical protein
MDINQLSYEADRRQGAGSLLNRLSVRSRYGLI